MKQKLDAFIAFKTTGVLKREMIELAFAEGKSLSRYLNELCERHSKRKRKNKIPAHHS